MSGIPFRRGDGEKPLWVTERRQLPSGEWVLTVWLDTTDSKLSNDIHKQVATIVRHLMLAAPQKEEAES